jgi:hypothetical protein
MREGIVVTTMTITLALSTASFAQPGQSQFDDDRSQRTNCQIPAQTAAIIQAQLATVVKLPDQNGGLFSPNRMWSAVVDRVVPRPTRQTASAMTP